MKQRLFSFLQRAQQLRYVRLVIATAVGWKEVRVSRLAASLSFYALLSMVPLLVTFHAVFSLVIDQQTLAHEVDTQMTTFMGPEQAQVLRGMIDHAQSPSIASLQTIIGSILTFVTAGGVFIELKDSMDAIWMTDPDKRKGIVSWIREYFAPLSMVLGFGFLLLISLLLDALLSLSTSSLKLWRPALVIMLAGGNTVIGWVVAAVLFAVVFRWLPTMTVAWRDVWLGAALTATLFVIGRGLISFYIGSSDFTGKYGPAGAVVAIMVWVFYSAQILFTGAVFTREHARIEQRYSPSVPRCT